MWRRITGSDVQPKSQDAHSLYAHSTSRDTASISVTDIEDLLRDQVAHLLATVRTGPLCALQVDEGELVDHSIFDPVEQEEIDAILTVAEAAVAAGHLPLARAIGAMVGMAVADSLGHNFEFLPVQDRPSPHGPHLQFPPPPGGPPRGCVHWPNNVFALEAGQWTDDTAMGLCLADCLLLHGGGGADGLDGSALRVWFWCWWNRWLCVFARARAIAVCMCDAGIGGAARRARL